MVDPTEDTGSMPESTIAKEIKTILKSIGESNMGNLLGGAGSDGMGGGVLLGLLLGRSGILGGEGNVASGAAAIDAAVAAALASANQANNNSMLLLKDIQDSSQQVINNVTSGTQTLLATNLQGQIANLQGQASILAGVESSKGTIINEIHESESAIGAGISTLAASTAAAFNVVNTNTAMQTATVLSAITADGTATRALIQSIETAALNREIVVAQNEISNLRHRDAVSEGGVNVTNNINQTAVAQANATAQQQIVGLLGTLTSSLQHNTNSIVNLGTMRNSGQASTNVAS
jgi:hypothetical protein